MSQANGQSQNGEQGPPTQQYKMLSNTQKDNDYCQHFVNTGVRPQNNIRDIRPEQRFTDYPKLNELIKLKDDLLTRRSTPPM